MRSDFISLLADRARSDSSVMLLTGDLGYSVLEAFTHEFPRQFLNCGVAEQAMISVAAGLAASGRKVFVYSIVNFATLRCLEQIRNDVAYHGFNVCVVGIGAGSMYGSLGYSHHGLEDVAVMSALPNMKVYSPGTAAEVEQALAEIFASDGPAYLRLGRSPERILDRYEIIEQRDGVNVRARGGSVAILSTGATQDLVSEAIDFAVDRGTKASWSSFWQISPVNAHTLRELVGARPLILVEDHSKYGGFGATIVTSLASTGGVGPVEHFGFGQDAPFIQGSAKYLMDRSGLSARGLSDAIVRMSQQALA